MYDTNPNSERRRFPRSHLQMTLRAVRLDPDDGDVLDTLHMTDISRKGMGAVSDRPYYPGQRIVLCMPLRSDGGQRNLYATIVRCRQSQEGYRIGLEFDTASVSSWCSTGLAAAA